MSSERYLPWVIKYRPKHLNEVVNQEEVKQKLTAWLKAWEEGKVEKKAILLHGPAGCGKTSLVEALAKTYKYQLFEMNASDSRRKADIERIAKLASQTSGLMGRKIILLDEVDGLDPRADEGGVEALLEVIKNTRNPIIMTANNPYREHLRPLREIAEVIQMKKLSERDIITVLDKICRAENLTCDPVALREIAKRSEGDMRSAINDLEAAAALNKKVTIDTVKAVATYRNRVYAPWEALQKLFNATYIFQAREATTSTDLSHDEFITWINEHIPTYYETPEEVWRAYEALSRADVYLGRIVKSQNWDLLSYALEMMGPGVAFARTAYKYKWKPFKMPERIKLLAETRKSREYREALAEILAARLLTSKAIVKNDVIPYLRVIFTQNPAYAAKIAIGYKIPEELVKWLAGQKAREVLGYMKKPKK
ncbi:MAG: replication factor C large subunit [Desulfurococcaceae archaeon]|nr:replication factor C large subunit [Desulfurococcaceae archaeon]